MKRDFDLARTILIAIEANEDATGHGWITLGKINGCSQEQVSYHVRLLHEAGLIEAIDLSTITGFSWEPKKLTWHGHDFLESSRNETLWGEALPRFLHSCGLQAENKGNRIRGGLGNRHRWQGNITRVLDGAPESIS